MWWEQESEDVIGEEVVEADHPGSWMELPEKILSKWNKVVNLFLFVFSHLWNNIYLTLFLKIYWMSML